MLKIDIYNNFNGSCDYDTDNKIIWTHFQSHGKTILITQEQSKYIYKIGQTYIVKIVNMIKTYLNYFKKVNFYDPDKDFDDNLPIVKAIYLSSVLLSNDNVYDIAAHTVTNEQCINTFLSNNLYHQTPNIKNSRNLNNRNKSYINYINKLYKTNIKDIPSLYGINNNNDKMAPSVIYIDDSEIELLENIGEKKNLYHIYIDIDTFDANLEELFYKIDTQENSLTKKYNIFKTVLPHTVLKKFNLINRLKILQDIMYYITIDTQYLFYEKTDNPEKLYTESIWGLLE